MRDRRQKLMKTKEWIVPLVLYFIPVIGILSTGYYAFDSNNKTRRNWARCSIVFLIVAHLILLIFKVQMHNMTYEQLYTLISKLTGK